MKHILSALALSAALASPAWSKYASMGWGVVTCGEFHEIHDQYGKQEDVEQWIWGAFTGLNAASKSFGLHARIGKDQYKALYAAVLKYCRDNPLHDVAHATMVTYVELRGVQ